jgi:trehalose-6-phosphatase
VETLESKITSWFVIRQPSNALTDNSIVDFEGTLWKRDLTKEGLAKVMRGEAEIPEDAINVLKTLTQNKNNEVWLLSGLQVKDVLDRVAEKVPKLGIV